jgi:hypothetical protein
VDLTTDIVLYFIARCRRRCRLHAAAPPRNTVTMQLWGARKPAAAAAAKLPPLVLPEGFTTPEPRALTVTRLSYLPTVLSGAVALALRGTTGVTTLGWRPALGDARECLRANNLQQCTLAGAVWRALEAAAGVGGRCAMRQDGDRYLSVSALRVGVTTAGALLMALASAPAAH